MRAGRQPCDAIRPSGKITMKDTRFRGVRLIQLTGLLALAAFALAAFAQGWQQARAQSTRPMELTYVFRDGVMFNYSNESGWQGIVGDKIDAGYTWADKLPELFTRSNIRVVCAGRCPDKLYRYDESPQDKVVWKKGPPTVGGRIEIKCGNYHHCTVYQDDKRVHPNVGSDGDWEQVSYVELAPPAKP
jgi:hypothetical protein